MTAWLINPSPARKGKKRMATKRKPPKGFRTWKVYMAHIRGMKKGAKVRTSTRKTGGTVATRKKATRKRTTTRKRAPTRRRRVTARKRRRTGGAIQLTPIRGRVYKRNPPGGKLVKTLIDGAKNAVYAVLGKASARAVPDLIGLPRTGITGIATQAAVAVGVGMVADKVLPRGAGPFVVAGALMAPIESFIVSMNIPVLSGALSGYPVTASRAVRGIGSYARVGGMGSYARLSGSVGATPSSRGIVTGPGVLAGDDFNHALGF